MTVVPAQTEDNDSTTSVAASYEELRLRVLTGSARCGQVGRGLLLREGMAAWMARWPTYSVTVEIVTDLERRAAPIVLDALHAGVVGVLASIALTARKEMSR